MSDPSGSSAAGVRQRGLRRLWPWAVSLAVLLLDQLTKAWAVESLQAGRIHPFLPGVLQLQLGYNEGIAWSLLEGHAMALGLVSAVVALAVAGWMGLRPPHGLWLNLALALVLAGALGNGIDRWRLEKVIDFLKLVPIPFPIFNLADVAITVAAACFLIDSWQQRPRQRG